MLIEVQSHAGLDNLGDGSDHSFINQDVTSTGTPTFATVDTAELFNSGGDLKLQPDGAAPATLGDVTLFEDADVFDGDTPGRKFILHRKAGEGDARYEMYIDKNKTSQIASINGLMSFTSNNGSAAINFIGSEHSFGQYGNTANPPNKFWGYLTAPEGSNAKRYFEILVDDTDEFTHFNRQDADIVGLKINMPVLLPAHGLTIAADDVKLSLGADEAADSYFEWNETGYSKLRAYSAIGIYDFTAAADTDITFNFIGTTNSGQFFWDEDAAWFDYRSRILMSGAIQIRFRDPAIGIYSQADTFLDFFADGAVRIGDSAVGAPTNYVSFTDGTITQVGTGKTLESAKYKLTAIGGYAIRLTNKTGGNSVAGQLLAPYSATAVDDAVKTAAANSDEVFGITLDAGVADGSAMWVVVGGIADVLMDAGGSARGDRLISSATAGSADVWNVGGAVATHFLEIGHCVETVGGGALARTILHFN
ncbi:hypothetical protein LCGC14_1401570 [marine sediment metagenome]|uniref:Uncharacterized protein n=1 Tax=marine sediment metagenome TaxID=412755 RepID=A0A0F9MYI8_9ZZZZ